MFGLDFLDIGIGVALLFGSMSLICTAAREGLEGIFKHRAMDLERGIRELFDDPTGQNITKYILNHPLICSLYIGKYDPSKLEKSTNLMPLCQRRDLPSYIPAASFVAAVIDHVVRGAYDNRSTLVAAGQGLSFETLVQSADRLGQGALRTAVLSAIDRAQGDVNMVKTNLEQWYNGTMDRVSGWYKRRTQLILFVMGLAVAGAMNVDAITAVQRIAASKPLQADILKAVESLKPAAASEPSGSNQSTGVPAADAEKDALPDLQKLEQLISSISFPIGWPAQQLTRFGCTAPNPADCTYKGNDWLAAVLKMALGWFITALATMLGAPFWFDILNQLVVVRATVKPAEKSAGEASKDPQTALLALVPRGVPTEPQKPAAPAVGG